MNAVVGARKGSLLLSVTLLLLCGCSVHGDFESQAEFNRFLEQFHLVGLSIYDAESRLTAEGFSCSSAGLQTQSQSQCYRARRRWYWMGYEGQTVVLTYDPSSGLVTRFWGGWGRFMS